LDGEDEPIPSEWAAGDVILDQYEVKSVLGRGGFGEVFKVHHRGWGLDLAVKSLLPELFSDESEKADFIQECEAWIGLGLHPGVVSCYYVRDLAGVRIFSEYMDGGSLRAHLARGQLPVDTTLNFGLQILAGLAHSHKKGLIHLDIKPENVLLNSSGIVKITDFGIARAVGTTTGRSSDVGTQTFKHEGGLPGTPVYMPPEQWDTSLGQIGPWTDIYAFGVMLYEMMCGRRPFDTGGESVGVLRDRHLNAEPVNPKDLRPDLPTKAADLILSCLAKSTADRPQTCEELRLQLMGIYREVAGSRFELVTDDELTLHADSLNNHGVSMLDLGKVDAALDSFSKAIELNPHHLEAVYNRGLVRWRRGEISDEDFLTELSYVKELDSHKSLLIYEVHLERGDYEEALETMETAFRRYSDSEEVRAALESLKSRNFERSRVFELADKTMFYSDCIQLMPDGKRVMVTCKDKTVRIWNIETGECTNTFEPKKGEILRCAGVSPSLTRMVVGRNVRNEDGNELEFYRLSPKPKLVAKKIGPRAPYFFTPSEEQVVTGGYGCTYVWNADDGSLVFRLSHNATKTTPCYPVGFIQDYSKLLTASKDGELRVWDFATGECLRIIESHEETFGHAAISSDEKRVLTTGEHPDSKSIKGAWDVSIWSLESGEKYTKFSGIDPMIFKAHLSPHAKWALTLGWSGFGTGPLRLWDLQTKQCVRTFDFAGRFVVTPDERFIIGLQKRAIVVWPVTNDPSNVDLLAHIKARYSICKPKATLELVKHDSEAKVLIDQVRDAVDSEEWEQAATLVEKARSIPGFEEDSYLREVSYLIGEHGQRKGFTGLRQISSSPRISHVMSNVMIDSLTGSRDGSQMALTTTVMGAVFLWDWQSDDPPREVVTEEMIRSTRRGPSPTTCVGFTDDGKYLRILQSNRSYWKVECANGECVDSRRIPFDGFLASVSFSGISPMACVTVGTKKGQMLSLWNLDTGKKVRDLKGLKRNLLTSSTMTSDERWVIAAGYDKKRDKYEACLWDATKGKVIRKIEGLLEGGPNIRLPMAVSSDGQYLAIAPGVWPNVYIWDLRHGAQVGVLEGSTARIHSLVFTSDNRFLLSADSKGARVWDMKSLECVHSHQITGIDSSIQSLVSLSEDARWLARVVKERINIWEIEWDFEL
jgi:serine/threonine protein kinase/WD40 repeat protein